MHSPLAGAIYAVAVLAGPVEDYEACCAAAPVPPLPTSCLLEPPPRPPELPQPPPEPIPDPTRPPLPPPVRL